MGKYVLIQNLKRIIRLSNNLSSISGVQILIQLLLAITSAKLINYKRKNRANWTRKRLKMVIYMRHSVKKPFM